MSYLLDRKIKRKKFLNIVVLLLLAFGFFYFRTPIFNSLSSISHKVFRPVLVLQNKLSNSFINWSITLSLRNSLVEQNENLRLKLMENNLFLLNYNSLLDENIKIKEILGRKNEKVEMLLSAILSKPNRSPYDSLVIDVGINDGVERGDLVFALGNIPVGRISQTYINSSKVILFSNSGDKTEVVVTGQSSLKEEGELARNELFSIRLGGDIFMQMIGRGGGNFEIILPRDFILKKGSVVTLPGIFPYVVAIVDTIISDPRDSFAKILLTSPVNIQELKFIQVKVSAK